MKAKHRHTEKTKKKNVEWSRELTNEMLYNRDAKSWEKKIETNKKKYSLCVQSTHIWCNFSRFSSRFEIHKICFVRSVWIPNEVIEWSFTASSIEHNALRTAPQQPLIWLWPLFLFCFFSYIDKSAYGSNKSVKLYKQPRYFMKHDDFKSCWQFVVLGAIHLIAYKCIMFSDFRIHLVKRSQEHSAHTRP